MKGVVNLGLLWVTIDDRSRHHCLGAEIESAVTVFPDTLPVTLTLWPANLSTWALLPFSV
jgi:hypothetical protein